MTGALEGARTNIATYLVRDSMKVSITTLSLSLRRAVGSHETTNLRNYETTGIPSYFFGDNHDRKYLGAGLINENIFLTRS